jgi:hypothetical protein
MRALAWSAVEQVLATLPGSPDPLLPVACIVEVRHERHLDQVRTELTRLGLVVSEPDKARWPFGRRWSLVAQSGPIPITRAGMDSWLDRIDASLSPYDAVVAGWMPLNRDS